LKPTRHKAINHDAGATDNAALQPSTAAVILPVVAQAWSYTRKRYDDPAAIYGGGKDSKLRMAGSKPAIAINKITKFTDPVI